MAVWTIDGVVEAAELRNRKGKYVVLKTVTFRGRDGAEHVLKTVAAAGEVAQALTPGTSGRFYVSKGLDQTGVHGMRLDDGRAAFDWYTNIELMGMIMMGGGLFMLLVALGGYQGLGLFAVLALPVGAIFFALARKARVEGKTQYEDDSGNIVSPA